MSARPPRLRWNRLRCACVAALGLWLLPAAGLAEPRPPAAAQAEEIDALALGAMLLRDGHLDRAGTVLAEVDQNAPGLDLPRYHLLVGLVALKSGRHSDAVRAFEKSLAAGQTDPMVWVFLAQARFGAQDLPGTLAALDRAGPAADKLAGTHLIRAQCHWRLGHKISAWIALDAGCRRHPEIREIQRHKVLLLVDMGLFQEARREGQGLLSHPDSRPEDHLAIAEALRRGKQLQQAADVLEAAWLRFPDSTTIPVQLAHTCLDAGRTLSAAMILEQLSRREPRFTVEAAELYRRAGQKGRALLLNARVPAQEAKIRQRLGLLVDAERFEEAASMEIRLRRLGLLQDDAIAYALAYAFYRTGRFASAERQLKRIEDADLFAQANQLRRAMDACQRKGWTCE